MIALAVVGCSDVLGLTDPRPIQLGADCTGPTGGDPSQCPVGTDVCMTETGSADFCSLVCGTTPAGTGTPVPPDSGDLRCAQLATTGTPACTYHYPDPNDATVELWLCEIECGSLGGNDLGTCPLGLTCTNNLCQ